MVEVHHQPDQALSDGMQSLFPDQFDELMVQVRQIAAVLGRDVPRLSVTPDLQAVGTPDRTTSPAAD
jgi:3-deoxy-7-phosphoheptulonate synthase